MDSLHGMEVVKLLLKVFVKKDLIHNFVSEIVMELVQGGFIPSFCTSCYRKGRTGADFMSLAKPGLIKRFCNTNALLTFKEYLNDYAPNDLKIAGNELIEREIFNVDDQKIKEEIKNRLELIESGKRDVYV